MPLPSPPVALANYSQLIVRRLGSLRRRPSALASRQTTHARPQHARLFHGGGVFGEACFQARREARRCARCGLLHEDYDMIAKWLDYLDKFDCEIYIPDACKLQMDGNTIILPEHVINKLDKIRDAKKLEHAKLKQDASKEQ